MSELQPGTSKPVSWVLSWLPWRTLRWLLQRPNRIRYRLTGPIQPGPIRGLHALDCWATRKLSRPIDVKGARALRKAGL